MTPLCAERKLENEDEDEEGNVVRLSGCANKVLR